MIRIEAFVDDKKLAQVLHLMDGLVLNLKVQPVRNAAVKNGHVVGAGQPTSAKEVVLFVAKKGKGAGFMTKEAQDYGKNAGIPASSIYSAIHKLLKDGLLKRTKPSTYVLKSQ